MEPKYGMNPSRLGTADALKVAKLFRRLADESIHGMLIIEEGRIVYANEALAQIIGIPLRKLMGLKVEKALKLVIPDQRDLATTRYQSMIKGEISEGRYEYQLDSREGPRFVEAVSKVVKVNGRSVICVVVIDVTERRRAEHELREMKETYRALVEQSLQGLAIIQDGRIVYANQALADIFGYDLKRMLSMTPQEVENLMHPEDREMVLGRLRERLEGNDVPWHYEFRGLRSDGSVRWLEILARRIDFLGRPAVQAVLMDLTERKRAEAAHRESEEKFRALVKDTADWVWEVDVQGRYTYSNNAAEDILGYTAGQVLGRTPLDFLHPQEVKPFKRLFNSLVKEPRSLRNHVNRYLHRDGSTVVLETSARPILDEQGRLLGFRGISRDVTVRQEMEEQLRQYTERLEDLVEERTKQLLASQERLVAAEKLATIGRLAAGLSHDLRNPLHVIRNLSTLFRLQMKEGASEDKMHRYLELLEREVDTVNRILSELLDFARTPKPIFAPASISRIVRDALQAVTIPSNVEVVSQVEPITVVVDAEQLRRVFINLITNAVEAMTPAGGTLEVYARRVGGMVEVTVADTGRGIDPKHMHRLFDPLFTTKVKGVGLGLATCKMLVEGHGGTITVDSTLGRGSAFTVRLPLQPKSGESTSS